MPTKTQQCFRNGKWQVDELANLCEKFERQLEYAQEAIDQDLTCGLDHHLLQSCGCKQALEKALLPDGNEKSYGKIRSERDAALVALRRLVYRESPGVWCVGVHGDSDVTAIVGPVLSAEE